MPVVINEFEAVAEQAAPAHADPAQAPKPAIKPAELRKPIARMIARRSRIWAH